MSGEHYGHRGGGANTLCLHPQGQLPGQDPTSSETALSLKAKSHPDYCADINHGSGDNLYMYYNCHKGDNQDFYFESWPPPARIRTRSGNKCLDYNWGNGNLYFFDCHDGSNQLWFFRDGDEKTVPYDASEARRIGSRHDNKCIDMNTGNNNLYMYDCHDGDNQKFFFDKRVKLSGNENGNLLYGMEYQNTGANDASHDVDAACAVCQRSGKPQVPPVVDSGTYHGLSGFIKFNWADAGATYPPGADPFEEEWGSGGCVDGSPICRGRIPSSASPTHLLSKNANGNWALWQFDGSAKANKILLAMQQHQQVCSKSDDGPAFAPVAYNGYSPPGNLFAYTDGQGSACDGYGSAGSGGWSMIMDDDGHWCNPAFKMGATVNSNIQDDFGYCSSGCGTKVGGFLAYR
jgi:hypothetical protein